MFMQDSLTFVMGEVIFLLLICCGFLIFITRNLKRERDTLIEQYKELRQRTRLILNELNFAEKNGIPEKLQGDTIGIFLHGITQYSTERFKKIVHGGMPSLAPDIPFGAKVAALRYLVAMAEAENRTKQNSPENWLVFDKKMADIVRWVRSMPNEYSEKGGRIKQLQERIDTLKKQEMDNSRLKRQLTLARQKSETLTKQSKDQQDSIRKLQTMINAFQRAFPHSSISFSSELDTQSSFPHQHQERVHAYEGSVFQIASINDLSKKKQGLVKQLTQHLSASLNHLEKSEREKFEDKVEVLELDIIKSDNHITNLQNELKSARNNTQQLKQMKQDIPSSVPASKDNDALSVAEPTNDENELNFWMESGGPQRSMEEIDKLRINNQNQRRLILELNSEIAVMRESMLVTEGETLKEEKRLEIVKLERLLKECEFCIETLESEVELLRDQMIDENEKLQHPDIERLNRDIEHMSSQLHQTIEQYSQANTVKKFATHLLDCNSIDSIAQLLIATLSSINIAYGFYLDSDLDKIEYYSDGIKSPQEQKSLKIQDSTSDIGYTNDGIIFFRPHARLLFRNPPDDDEAQAMLEVTLDTIIQLTNSKINHLDSQVKLSEHDSMMSAAMHKIASTISQIKVRHYSQSSDAKKIMIDFTREIEASLGFMKPSPAVKAVFDNAISECHQQMELLLDESKTIDKHTQDIINLLKKNSSG